MTTAPAQLIRRLVAGVVVVNLLIAGLATIAIERNRSRDSKQAAVTLSNLSQILEQDIAGFLGKVDLMLLWVRDGIVSEIAGGGIDRARLDAVLADNDARLPEVLGLSITDAEGTIQYAIGEATATKVNISDHSHFVAVRDDPMAGLVISGPAFNRASNEWTIALGRRINNPDGSFAGDIHAVIAINQFVQTFASINVGPKGLVAMRDRGTALVARHPEPESVGSALGNTAVSETFREVVRSGKSSGVYKTASAVDGIERLFLSRKIPGYPLYLTIGLSPEDYLADWRHDSALLATLAGIVMLSIDLSSWLVIRFWSRQMRQAHAAAYQDAIFTAQLLQSREKAELLRQEAEQARQQSEILLASAGEGVCGVDSDGCIIFLNQTGREILGLSVDDGLGANLHTLAHHHHADGRDHPVEECPLYLTLHDGMPRRVESDVYWRTDGTSVPVEFTSAPIFRDGVLVGAVNVFRDVSRRLRAEEQVARNLAITATMESVLRLSLEPSSLATILDQALEELLALPWLHLEDRGCIFLVDEAHGDLRIAAQRNLAPETARNCATLSFGQCLCGSVAARGESVFSNCVDHRHTTRYPGMPDHGHYCAPITSGGKVLGVLNTYVEHGHRFDEEEERFLMMFTDTLAGIIERKQAQSTTERALSDLSRSNEELQQFAYVASHDLREPLRVVSSYVSLLQRHLGDALPDDCRTFITFAIDGVHRMEALIRDLLEYSRIGHDDPMMAPVAMGEVADIAITNLGAAIDESHAIVEVSTGLPMVLGNFSELIRLLQNLIGNAIKYCADNRRLRVALSCEDKGKEWIFSVTDNGIGIDQEHFDRIFMVFQRLHGRGVYEGTGIGLATCKKITERHGGRIWVESNPGEGSRFLIALPKMSIGETF